MSETAKKEQEKYNYLASAEMGEEENYNMIDGVVNNVRKGKASILEQLRRFEPEPSEYDNKPERSIVREK